MSRRHVLPVLAVTLLLAGCAAEPVDEPATPTPSPTATASPTPTAVVPASVQCLESGTWVVDNARAAELFAEGLRSSASDVTAERSGESVWEFADGTLTRTFTDWQLSFSAVLELPGSPAVTETTTLGGVTTAAYEVTETDVVTQPADVSALTVDLVVTENGAPRTFDDPGSSARRGEEQAESWGYTCDGDTLLLADRLEDGTLSESFGTILLHRR